MPAQYMYPSAPAAETRPPIYMYMYDSLPLSYFAPPPPSIEGSKRLRTEKMACPHPRLLFTIENIHSMIFFEKKRQAGR